MVRERRWKDTGRQVGKPILLLIEPRGWQRAAGMSRQQQTMAKHEH